MALLGFDALGRFALGQITHGAQDATVNLTGVSGSGVARSIAAPVGGGLTGVAGVGTVGGASSSIVKLLVGVAGVGQVGSIIQTDSSALSGVSGTGVARSLSMLVPDTINGVSGTGVAGSILVNSTTPVIVSAVGIGVAGAITAAPSGNPAGASGTGVAGIITAGISGGGTSGSTGDDDRPRRKKPRTGLEPIAKLPPAPPPPKPKPVELPPEWAIRPRSPALVPAQFPSEPDYPGVAEEVPNIARQMMDARDITAIERMLDEQDSDEQDTADIADVLALLD